MKKINQHIINQINIDVTTASEERAFRLKSGLDGIIYDQFLPRAEVLFDEITPLGEIVRYDSIDLEIQLQSGNSMEQLSELLLEKLREKMNINIQTDSSLPESFAKFNDYQSATIDDEWDASLNKKSAQPVLSEAISDLENTILYFLETGQLPWYAKPAHFSPEMEDSAISALIANKVFLQKLMRLLAGNANALERFVLQIKSGIVIETIGHFTGAPKNALAKLEAGLKSQTPDKQKATYKYIIQTISSKKQISPEKVSQELEQLLNRESPEDRELEMLIQEILQAVLPNKNPESSERLNARKKENTFKKIQSEKLAQGKSDQPEQSKPEKIRENEALPKVLYVQNAGLILTHPFLPSLLAETGCLDEQNQLKPAEKQKAVQLFHYLATGLEADFEFNQTLEKYICGMQPETPLIRESQLTENDRNECDDLLKSVIKYWPELKNTSSDGLRQLFFDRAGKLDFNRMPHKLYVERKAQDVLLDKLQWNISVVKLPWMNDLLFVEW